ncbi:hypothetical protein [Anatilimnocola floriformis]|uniref:hypothetical protein n=1 Tax=Anatilimnocola floriformis TaxID=2948575 RepID=UPI0020C2D2D9|nr:hypothetical protein [Anatilimnocola floriformis]
MQTQLFAFVSLSLICCHGPAALAQQPKPIKELANIPVAGGVAGPAFVMSPDGKWFGVGIRDQINIQSLPEGSRGIVIKIAGTH